jgi:NADH-quinone oxidoreductase subunit H
MISYELPLVLALTGVVMLTSILAGSPGYPGSAGIGTISLKEMMTFQSTWKPTGIGLLDFIFNGFTPWSWFILVQPLMLLIYYICGLAETNRSPFDLPEAESELVAGFHTEYSGIRFGMFWLGEYGNMTIVSAITTFLFLGGWSGPGVAFLTAPGMAVGWQLLGNLLALLYMVSKIYLLCLLFTWIRGTLPRLRSDQLMQFAWLLLLPATLGNIVLTGLIYLVVSGLGLSNLVFLIVTGAINWLLLIGFIRLVGRATVATTRRAQAPAIRARLRQAALLSAATPAEASAGGAEIKG